MSCRRRFDNGVALCESLLELCPESCTLRDALADLHIKKGNGEQAVSMWLHALAECPNNAEVFYHCCKFLMAQVSFCTEEIQLLQATAASVIALNLLFCRQEKSSAIAPLFRGFVLSFCEDQQSQKRPVDVLRYVTSV